MADSSEDLRATAESIRHDAESVRTLEDEKLGLEPDDPLVDELSERVDGLIDEMSTKAAAERELADEIDAAPDGGNTAT